MSENMTGIVKIILPQLSGYPQKSTFPYPVRAKNTLANSADRGTIETSNYSENAGFSNNWPQNMPERMLFTPTYG